ncbi:MAG: hypothetical protein QM703_25470 [Gemmatales bacterium]
MPSDGQLSLIGNLDRLLRMATGLRACLTKEHPDFIILRDVGDNLSIAWEGKPPAFCRSMALRVWGEIADFDNSKVRHYEKTPTGVVLLPTPEEARSDDSHQ